MEKENIVRVLKPRVILVLARRTEVKWRDGDTGQETVIPLKFDDPPCKRGNISSPVTYGHFEYSFVEVPGFVFFPINHFALDLSAKEFVLRASR